MHPVAHLRPVLQLNTYTAYEAMLPVQTVTIPPHAYPEQNKAAQFQSINDWRRQNIHCKYKRIPGYQTSYLANESLFANCNASSSCMGWKSCMELRISQTKPKLKIKKCSKGSPCLTFLWWIISSFGISRYIRWIWFCGWRQWWICGSPTYHSWLMSAPNVIEQ